jgi:hypothetical protein
MDIEEIFSKIDLSRLSLDEQEGFKNWLKERSQMLISIESSLRKGQPVSVSLGRKVAKNNVDYFIRI